MAITLVRIAAEVTRKFKDLDCAAYPTSPIFFGYLGDVHSDIQTSCRIYPDVNMDVTLDGVNREFAYDATILRIWSATYFTSATSYKVLRPTSIDKLDNTRRTWRQTSASAPTYYYENGGNIGFYPTPPTATVGGYPKATLACTVETVLVAGNSLPTSVKSPWPWVYGICGMWAADRHPELEDKFTRKYAAAFESLKGDIFGRIARDKEYANFDMPMIGH